MSSLLRTPAGASRRGPWWATFVPLGVVVLLTLALMALGQFLGWGAALTGLFFATPDSIPTVATQPDLAELPSAEELNQQRLTLLQEIATLNEQITALTQTRETLEQAPPADTPLEIVQARVLYRDPNQLIPSFILNVGSQDGIVAGQPVMGQASIIGRISAVWPNRSRVDLLTGPGVAFGALVQSSRALGVVSGDRGRLTLNFVAKSAPVASGDLVVTSGVPGITPAGLPIGVVESVVTENEALTLSIVLQALENPWTLEIAQVLLATDAPLPEDALEEPPIGSRTRGQRPGGS